jgi:hexosaminidase
VTRENCDLLQEATSRYNKIILQNVDFGVSNSTSLSAANETWKKDPNFKAYIDSLEIQLMAPCEEMPYLHMDEHCEYDFMVWTHAS